MKINTVALAGINDDEIADLAALTLKYPLHVRFIEVMPLGADMAWAKNHTLSLAEVKAKWNQPVGSSGHSHRRWSGPGVLLCHWGGHGGVHRCVIARLFATVATACLTADSRLKPCLASDKEIDVKQVLRQGAEEKN